MMEDQRDKKMGHEMEDDTGLVVVDCLCWVWALLSRV